MVKKANDRKREPKLGEELREGVRAMSELHSLMTTLAEEVAKVREKMIWPYLEGKLTKKIEKALIQESWNLQGRLLHAAKNAFPADVLAKNGVKLED